MAARYRHSRSTADRRAATRNRDVESSGRPHTSGEVRRRRPERCHAYREPAGRSTSPWWSLGARRRFARRVPIAPRKWPIPDVIFCT